MMHAASQRQCWTVVDHLLQHAPGIINCQDGHWRTALISATADGDIDAVRELVERGADVLVEDKVRALTRTMYHAAAFFITRPALRCVPYFIVQDGNTAFTLAQLHSNRTFSAAATEVGFVPRCV
jgi:ankyrin repeat protein